MTTLDCVGLLGLSCLQLHVLLSELRVKKTCFEACFFGKRRQQSINAIRKIDSRYFSCCMHLMW